MAEESRTRQYNYSYVVVHNSLRLFTLLMLLTTVSCFNSNPVETKPSNGEYITNPSGTGIGGADDELLFIDNYDTPEKKMAFTCLKLTFGYLDADEDLAYEVDTYDSYITQHQIPNDFLSVSCGTYWDFTASEDSVISHYNRYMKAMPTSSVYATDEMVESLTAENIVLDRVLMINHVDNAMQPLVYDYITKHTEFDDIPRWMNVYPTRDANYMFEKCYALYDKRYSEEIVTRFHFSCAGEYFHKIAARHYDIIGYAYNDFIKTMTGIIIENFMQSELYHETTLLFHANVLYLGEDVLSGNYTLDDFISYLKYNAGGGTVNVVSSERIVENGCVKYKVELQGAKNSAKIIHAEMRTVMDNNGIGG